MYIVNTIQTECDNREQLYGRVKLTDLSTEQHLSVLVDDVGFTDVLGNRRPGSVLVVG